MRALAAAVGLLCAAFAGPASAELKTRDGRLCHDVVLVGEVKAYGEFVSYYELDPSPNPDDIYIGGRQEMTVEVQAMVDGGGLPRMIQVRALMASQYRLPVRMLFYLQKEERGSWWAAEWRRISPEARGDVKTPEPPSPRCKT